MEKYYCSTCGEFKNRMQIKKIQYQMQSVFECKCCNKETIFNTDELFLSMAKKYLKQKSKKELKKRNKNIHKKQRMFPSLS